MTGRPKPEPSGRVEPSLAFQLPWRNVSAYPPERLEDVEKTILQCRVGLFHLERSIAFVSGEVLDEMHHGLSGLDSVLRILSRALNDDNCRKIHDAAVSIFEPLEPWAAAVIKSEEDILKWSYCEARSMRLLLEPLMPGILADIAPDEILKVQYGFDAAKRHIEGLDDLATFEEDIARKERRRESLPRKELRWYKVKVMRKPKTAVVDIVG